MGTPNTCSNCAHWRVVNNTSLRVAEQVVGECRGGTPCSDFKWPRTTASSTCAQHSNAAQVAFATARAEGHREGLAMLAQIRGTTTPDEWGFMNLTTRFRAAAEKAGIKPGDILPDDDPRLKVFQRELFDEGAGSAGSSGQPDRNGGPAAAVDAVAPQSTAATSSETSPSQARPQSAEGTARSVSRSGPRRKP